MRDNSTIENFKCISVQDQYNNNLEVDSMVKPNILMIISHDTGRYLGSYGKKIETPALNQLAEEGIQFNHYFCSQPQCSPSRGSILTGMYGHNHGMLGLAHLGHSMNSQVKTIPSEVKKVGYSTWLFGFHHESIAGNQDAEKLGYDHVIKIPTNAASKVTDKLEDFLTEKANNDDIPFYASVGFEETHLPVDHFEPDPIDSVEVPPYLPDTAGVKNDIAHFHGSVKALDSAVGRIMKKLKETGLDKNTILIYTTDHGIPFPRAKGTLLDSGLETALIMRFPEDMYNQGGLMKEELLCNIDLMPTLLEAAGADIPEEIDGHSFLPLIAGDDYQPRESFFCELTWHDRYHPMRGIRTNKYKYIRNFEKGPKVYLPLDIHQTLAGQDVRDEYYVPNTEEELYDLHNDPLEQINLADDEQFMEVVKGLRSKVEEWMKATNDPLLHGPVPGEEAPGWKEEVEKGNFKREFIK